MITLNKSEILTLRRLPGRIDVDQVALLLGFQPHDVPILIRHKLIVPLGNPAPCAPKWFSSAEIQLLSQDTSFLSKATRIISQHWKRKNKNEKSAIP
jgi:hypothetical protein